MRRLPALKHRDISVAAFTIYLINNPYDILRRFGK